ncbi:uncharacterized protein LOC133194704 [Saccostrea echinata]|uniref:uncharacterized protein LOC133194704 n=1 Tax=Saccostrea echinata TaxID=191078 RepID=UPI002A8246D4|nr:uncharacterized protein LOC133194704 [Saccostrea echinata]
MDGRHKVKVDPLKDVSFSQDSVKNKFAKGILQGKELGAVLDAIIEGKKDYLDYILKNMEEAEYKKPNKYYARNNRSLWLLKQLSLNDYSKVFEIWRSTTKIEDWRFTTKNDGAKIMIRGNPGGKNTKPADFWAIATQPYLLAFAEREEAYNDESDDDYDD